MIDTKAPTVLEVPTDFDTDFLLVLSSHKSKAGGRMLTAHFPGNWGGAKFGGQPKTLNIAYASRLKDLVVELDKANRRLKWPLFIEADHHGPTCNVPIIFVEVGSTESEWKDVKAAAVVAQAVSESLRKQKTYETVFGVGGGHYSKEFTKVLLESSIAVGHIAPKYAIDGLDEEMFSQAIEKNVEKVKKVFVLREGTNSLQKEKTRKLAEIFGIEYELV